MSVPFNDKDLPKILDSLNLYLTYTKTKFNILNKEVADQLNLIKPSYNYYGDNWAFNLVKTYSYENKKYLSLVVLHDIPYKLDLTLLYSYIPNFKDLLTYNINNLRPSYIKEESNLSLFNGFLESLKHYSFEVSLPIGSVDVSASRETLQYTEKTCIEVYKYLYKMFIEFYQNLRIDLIHHPNLIEACFNYEKYPDDLRREVLSQLVWAKENLRFLSRYSIFKDTYYPSDNYKQYILDSAYISKKGNYEDVLKKVDTNFIFTGSYKYIICVQDTTYKNYSKYIKFFLQKHNKDNHRRTYIICIPENELVSVYDWIQDCLPTVYLSNLIIDYDNNHVKQSVKKTDEGFFKCLRFYPDRKRTRAVGVNCFLNESVASQNPTKLQYYLSQEDIDKLPEELSFIPSFKINDNEAYVFISSLNNYLKQKNISITDLFFTNKVSRNFKHSNWVNILDIIKQDYIDNKKYFVECGQHIFKYNYVRQHKSIFNLFSKEDILLKDSLYSYINNSTDISRLYLKRNQFLLKLILLVRPDVYIMDYKLDKIHIDDFVDFKVPIDIEKECLDFYNECVSYTKNLPFLQIYEHKYYLRNSTDIDNESFLFYINVMEKELNLQKKIVSTKSNTTSSEFYNLINNIKTKFLVTQVV